MEIYKGFYYFRKHNGKIKKADYFKKRKQGTLIKVVGGGEGLSFHILVNKKDSLRHQIETVLHEFGHLGIEYQYIIEASMKENSPFNLSELETRINKSVKKFYLRNPPLIKWIVQRLASQTPLPQKTI